MRGRPGIEEERAEAEVVAVALDFDFGHVDKAGQAFEGGDGVGAHDLRRDEEVKAIDEAGGEEGGVEARAGFGEESEDAFFAKFQEDWGPKSEHANPSAAHVGLSQSCGSGVVIQLDYKAEETVSLFVERGSGTLSFAPWPECPGRHLHFKTWLKTVFGGG